MSDNKFKDRYRIESNRLKGYNYWSDGWYFITICTKDRKHYFGCVVDGKMVLNEMGKIINDEIVDLKNHFKYIEIYEYVIMPNHMHVVMFLNVGNIVPFDVYGGRGGYARDVFQKHLYNDNNEPNTNDEKFTKQYFANISPAKWTMWNIIKLFKWFTNKKIKKLNQWLFARQPNYYDHIIRDDEELQRIKNYIIDNPTKRERDRNNKADIYM